MASTYESPVSEILLGVMAREVAPNPSLRDDLIQEARIAVWRAQERHPGQRRGYYMRAAKNRMLNIIAGRPMLGETSNRGTPVDPLRRPHESLDALAPERERRELEAA